MTDLSRISSDDVDKLLNSESVESLKAQLRNSTLMVMALMDTVKVSKVNIARETLLQAEGAIETYYDIDRNEYIIKRIK